MEDRDQDQNCLLVSCLYHAGGECLLGECGISDFEYRTEVERSEAISHYEAAVHDDRTTLRT